MRPHQWVKNLFVLLPVVFAQEIFDFRRVGGALLGFVCFSLLASSVYILNDLVDVDADRAHPVKKNRPIANSQVSESVAKIALVVIAAIALTGAAFVDLWFLACLVGYLVNNIGYSFGMKHIAYVDVLQIAIGFELRVVAGSFAADVPPSAYLLVATFLLAMYLGLGKRMHELVQQEGSGSQASRKVLAHYNTKVVSALLWVMGLATIVTYIVYTLDPSTRVAFGTDLLVISSIFGLFGVLRFGYLVRSRPEAESPTEEMLKDIPFIANLGLWAATIVAIVIWG